MKIADNVEMLEISGENGVLHPVLLWDDNDLVLIDAALPGQIELLREAVLKAGFALEEITKLIITHQDMDHIGCAKELAETGVKILAHELEAPYIQGDKLPIRIADMESRFNELSEGEREFYEQIKKGAPNFYVKVDTLLKDQEELSFCGGIKVVHTPGHMPGHIALLLEQSNIMVAGDAANIIDGNLAGPNPYYTRDMPEAQISFEKMVQNKPDYMVCYHGGCIPFS